MEVYLMKILPALTTSRTISFLLPAVIGLMTASAMAFDYFEIFGEPKPIYLSTSQEAGTLSGHPEWKCEMTSNQSHVDGPITYRCLSLYGEEHFMVCHYAQHYSSYHVPSFDSGCSLPGSSIVSILPYGKMPGSFMDVNSLPNWQCGEIVSEHELKQAMLIWGAIETESQENSSKGVSHQLPEWKCMKVSDQSAIDGALQFECRSLYGEVETIACSSQEENCALPGPIRIRKDSIG